MSRPSFEPNPAAVEHRFLIVTNATGGRPPYQFRYSGLPVGCASQNLSEYSCRSNSTGSYLVVVNVTDSAGTTVTSNATLRVNSGSTYTQETWQETGLGASTPWGIAIYGTDYNSTTRQIDVYLEPGYYPYTVDGIPGYSATPASGSIVANGSFLTINIAFAHVLYPVTFHQTGLPNGTSWRAIVGGQTEISTNATARFELPNETSTYAVAPPIFWRALPPDGILTVDGGPTTVNVTFEAIPTFSVSFFANGLPNESSWSVNLNGTILATAASNVSTIESDGTYPFYVRAPAGWTATPDQGNVSVEGLAVQERISFAFYRLTLHETGLPGGTNWSAFVNGTLLSGTTANLTEGIRAGTYDFGVSAIPGWTASPAAGVILVGPNSTGVAEVSFSGPVEKSNVTFLGSGLASNLSWSVVVDGQDEHAGVVGLTVQLANGSYGFSVNAPAGWVATPSNGTILVSGKPVDVPVAFNVPAPLATSLLGADPQSWVVFVAALSGSLVAGGLAGVAVVRLRARSG